MAALLASAAAASSVSPLLQLWQKFKIALSPHHIANYHDHVQINVLAQQLLDVYSAISKEGVAIISSQDDVVGHDVNNMPLPAPLRTASNFPYHISRPPPPRLFISILPR
jgi:hypothetical protein